MVARLAEAGDRGELVGVFRGQAELAAFAARAAGERPPVTTADARRTLELSAAIYASAFTDRTVRAGEIGPGDPFYASMQGSGAPWAAVPA